MTQTIIDVLQSACIVALIVNSLRKPRFVVEARKLKGVLRKIGKIDE